MPRPRKLPGFWQANYIITSAWTAAFLLMMIGQIADDLCAGPAAVVRTCDRVRRPQQRGLFHPMVSRSIGAAKYGTHRDHGHCRAVIRWLLQPDANTREHDDEGRIRQTRAPTSSPPSCSSRSISSPAMCCWRPVSRSPAPSRQVIYARIKGEPLGFMTYASLGAGDRARQRDAPDQRSALRAGKTRDRAFCDRRHHAQARLDAALHAADRDRNHSGIRHGRRLRLGGADVRARRSAPSRSP